MNVHALSRAAVGGGFRRSHSAGGPLTVTIDHAAGSLFGFQRGVAGTLFNYGGAGELSAPALEAGPMKAGITIGSFLQIALGIWLFYRGWKQPKKWNLQTVAGFFLFGSGIGRVADVMNPEQTAVAWATIANGQFTKNT